MARGYKILGGKRVSSKQLSEWGSSGGRPRKWSSEAERKKWSRQQKALAEGRKIRGYRSYGETNIKRLGICSNCNWTDDNPLQQDWEGGKNWQGREVIYSCRRCHLPTMIKLEEETGIKRAGSGSERFLRWKSKK